MKNSLLCLLLLCSLYTVQAQKNEKVTMEEVKQQCSGMPLDKRARLSVSRFTVATSTPQNSSTTDTKAINSLNTIAQLMMMSKGGGGNGAYSSKNAPKAGKQLGAQIVVTGEVLEYSVKDKGAQVLGVGAKNKTVKM